MINLSITNIGNKGREIYVWYRSGRELCLLKEKTFFPYFYQPNPKGIFTTIEGKRVQKIICLNPYDIRKQKTEESYEADVSYTRRYLIDKVGIFTKAELKYSFVDIECKTKDLPNSKNPCQPVSCISCSNSYNEEITTFFLLDYKGDEEEQERQLLDDFVRHIRKEQFDFLIGHNFIKFDYSYLSARYYHVFGVDLGTVLSSIAQTKNLRIGPEEELIVPVDLSILDYLDLFKKVYRGEVSYALDSLAQKYLKEETWGKTDFNVVDKEIKDKNINDIKRMIALEKKFKIIEYYDELRRMSKCLFEDLTWNSKIIDMMLLQEAKTKGIVLPSKQHNYEDLMESTFEGAYRRAEVGRYEKLWKLDLSSAYPMSIIKFCLDMGNIKTNEGLDINGYKFVQNPNALLPTLAKKLITQKDTLKKQLKTLNPDSIEYKDLQIKYDGVKAVVNSLFGVCALKIFRLFDIRVASTITFLVRDLLHYVEEELLKRDMKVIYVDTDSIFCTAKEDPKELLNSLVRQWAKEKYNKDDIGIEFDTEGIFEKILIVALCHYKGYLRTSKGLKEEIKGLEMKRKDSSVFMQKCQNELIEKVLKPESQESISEWINELKEQIKLADIKDLGFPCKINADKEYKSIPIFARALEYTQEINSEFVKHTGDTFYYIYVDAFGSATRKSSSMRKNKDTGIKELKESETIINKDVLAFDEDCFDHVKNVNWEKMIDKTIISKAEHIFEAMKWDISVIKEVKVKKIKEIKKTESIQEKIEDLIEEEEVIKDFPEAIKCLVSDNVLPIVDINKEETLTELPPPNFTTALGTCYNGSCLDLLAKMPTDSVNLVFTSPPYNTGNKGKNKNMYTEYNDSLSDEDYYKLLSGCLTESLRVCNGLVFVNINYMNNNKKVLYKLMYEFVDFLRENIIWDKKRCQPPIGNILGKRYEYILVFSKNPKTVINNFRKNMAENHKEEFGNWISNIVTVTTKTDQTKFSKTHRAGFPVDLPKVFIDIYTKPGDVVLDPFFGLGSTAIAAEDLGRKWIGTELMSTYCDIAKERIAEVNELKSKLL